MKNKKTQKKKHHLSSLEVKFTQEAEKRSLLFEFEAETFTYIVVYKYRPDFKIGKNTFIETKGYFDKSDRRKIKAFTEQHPKTKLYMLFGNSKNK